MKKDFLLTSALAYELYEKFASNLPIIDYHNHLSVKQISNNKRFTDVYDLWIAPDPYKHRAMRMCGIEEKYITGDASKPDKFKAWCITLQKLIGNPLYHWAVMELESVFGIDELPNEENWQKIYDNANKYLQENNVTVEYFLNKFNVEFICPCASLTDDLSDLCSNGKSAPSLRGDDILAPSLEFINMLSTVLGCSINNLADYKTAIEKKFSEFKNIGCVFSDHALDNGFIFYEDDGKNDLRFLDILSGNCLCKEDAERLFSHLLVYSGQKYAEYGFILQLHIGAQRYTSSRLRKIAGKAGGFASIGNSVDIISLTNLLDEVEKGEYGLPKTVLFTLNPEANAQIAVLSGSYSKDGVAGLITQGPAWWWCDHKKGIIDMLENTAVFGVLKNFVGMTTDSRSFLSLIRHDYFRRVLCSWIAEKISSGDFPDNETVISELISDMCYKNAKACIENVRGDK